ncbi:hypothetical protein PARMER_03534 [Parabacteroides merdae ATCC 43184]|nr:hypothetical protein PARMER_03534 [Parabacteroides merdae ATCC 43184]
MHSDYAFLPIFVKIGTCPRFLNGNAGTAPFIYCCL